MKLSKIILGLVVLVSLTVMSIPAFAAYDSYFNADGNKTVKNGYYHAGSGTSYLCTVAFEVQQGSGNETPATAFTLDGTAINQFGDNTIELAFVYYDNTQNRWVNCGSAFAAKRDDGSGEMKSIAFNIDKDDASNTNPDRDGYRFNDNLVIHAYDHVAQKLYTVTTFKIDDDGSALTTFTPPSGAFWDFKEFRAYSAANPVSPADDAVKQETAITLEWTNLDAIATKYEIYFGTSATLGASDLVATYNTPATDGHTHTLTQTLAKGTEYFWRVDATMSGNVATGVVGSFWTKIATPAISSPASGSQDLDPADNLEIEFSTVTGAESYTVTVMQGANTYTTTGATSPITVQDAGHNLVMTYCTEYLAYVVANHSSGNASDLSHSVAFKTIPDVVTLTSPTGNNTPINPTFRWVSTPCATSYNFVLKKGTETIATREGLNVNSVTLDGVILEPYTEYTWNVVAVNSDGVTGKVGTPANFRTAMVWPNDAVVPADHAIQISTTPSFNWPDIAGGATYDITIDGNTYTNLATSEYVWAAAPFAFEYYVSWSVKVWNADRSESVTSPTFTFTTKMDTPNLISPANNATCVELSGDLTWQDFGAQSYELQYKEFGTEWDAATTTTITTTTNSYQYGGNTFSPDKKYVWRVQAYKNSTWTGFSEEFQFSTALSKLTIDNSVLGDMEKGLGTDVSLAVNAPAYPPAGHIVYTFELSTDNFATVAATVTVTNNYTAVFNGLALGTKYYWRAYSADLCGEADEASEANVYTFYTKPNAVTLVSPSGGDIPSVGDFVWNATDNADGYIVKYGVVNLDQSITTTNTTVGYSGLAASTTYNWTVTPFQYKLDGTMVLGTESAPMTFTTVDLSHPTMIGPLDGATNEMLDILFQWINFPNALYYGLEISKYNGLGNDGLFTHASIMSQPDQNNHVEGTKYMVDNQFEYGTTYYYHIRTAVDDGNGGVEWSAWSPVMSFTTIPRATPTPKTFDDNVCAVDLYNTITYETPAIAGVTYVWSVSDGGVINATNGNECTVTWNESGNMEVTVQRSSNQWQEWDAVNNQWVPFIDQGVDDNIVVAAPGRMPVELTYTDYEGNEGAPYCVNERITLLATISDYKNFQAEFDVADLYWLIEDIDPNDVTKTITTKYSVLQIDDYTWTVPGSYEVTFYAVSNEAECLDFTETVTINVLGTCDIKVAVDSDLGVCPGGTETIIESYVYGGNGSDYNYYWTPTSKFSTHDEARAILKKTYTDVTFTFEVTDNGTGYGSVTETTEALYKPYPSFKRVQIIPKGHYYPNNRMNLNNDNQNYRLIKTWDNESADKLNIAEWQTSSRVQIDEGTENDEVNYNLRPGINRFYLTMWNADKDCWNGPNRVIVYQKTRKNTDNEFAVGIQGTAFMNAYPNPCTTNLNVEAEFVDATSATVSIVNIEGKTIKTFEPVNGITINKNYNVEDINAGTYFLVLETNDDTIVWKFVKL